jgi:MFS family permease
MIIGSCLLFIVHVLFALPILGYGWFAVIIMIVLGVAFSLVPSALWPSVPKIIPMKQLGSAYAIIFYIQNIGLSLVPVLIGVLIDNYSKQTLPSGEITYDYTLPMAIFALFGLTAIVIACWLRYEDGRKGYGLELANIESKE